jgi:hypothetical protein
MNLRKTSHRWALWAFAAALLLKSAMPWLATASAEMQGKALVEVCTVYGVSFKALGGDSSQPAQDHGAVSHDGEQCALNALTALATPAPPVAPATGVELQGAAPPLATSSLPPADVCAMWVARLKQGPPSFA